MNDVAFTTYWPHTRALYDGLHIEKDPGLRSTDLLATFDPKTHGATIENDDLVALSKKVYSDTATGNEANLTALQVIRLQERIGGAPEQPFYLEQASKTINADMLETRETFRSIGDSVKRKDRLEESDEKKTFYSEIKYNITKLVGKTLTPVEDILRTIRNPETIDLENLDFEFAYERNNELKAVIEDGITRGSDAGTTADDLGNITTNASNLHSTSNVAAKLTTAIKAFNVRNKVRTKYLVMDVDTLARWSANTWTGKGGPIENAPIYAPNGGVFDMPNMPGLTLVVDPELGDDKKIYCLTEDALRTAQGPRQFRRSFDENRHAYVTHTYDFVQFLSVDKMINHSKIGNRYFSFVASYTTS